MRIARLGHVLQINGLTAAAVLAMTLYSSVAADEVVITDPTAKNVDPVVVAEAPIELIAPNASSTSTELVSAPVISPPMITAPLGDGIAPELTSPSASAPRLMGVPRGGITPKTVGVPKQTVVVVDSHEGCADRIWLFDTRSLCTEACRANLSTFRLRVSRVSRSGHTTSSSYQEYLSSLDPNRASLMYVHGNRRSAPQAIKRGLFAYDNVRRCPKDDRPMDWVIWSWPSDRDGFLLHDARRKADRTDTQSLYLASVVRDHIQMGQPTCMIGFSFGGRIVSGSLHALAGGSIAGRTLPGDHVQGAQIDVGMIAPALQSDWMTYRGAHRLATKNCDRLILLYNRKDAVLKNFWLLNRIRNVDALGYSGPVRFAARFDGTRLPVTARDCSPTIGRQHREADYYTTSCRAGNSLASLIPGCFETDQIDGR